MLRSASAESERLRRDADGLRGRLREAEDALASAREDASRRAERVRVLEEELRRSGDDLAAAYEAVRRHRAEQAAYREVAERAEMLQMELGAARAALADAQERLARSGAGAIGRRGTPKWALPGDDVGYTDQYEAHRGGLPVYPRFSPER